MKEKRRAKRPKGRLFTGNVGVLGVRRPKGPCKDETPDAPVHATLIEQAVRSSRIRGREFSDGRLLQSMPRQLHETVHVVQLQVLPKVPCERIQLKVESLLAFFRVRRPLLCLCLLLPLHRRGLEFLERVHGPRALL